MMFTPTQAVNGSVLHGRIVLGTNMAMSQNTGSVPTSFTDVTNLSGHRTIATTSVRPVIYNMSIPGNLEYSVLTNDAPSPATPWAGSPGCVVIYGTGLTVSTVYFNVDVEVTYVLRGRQ